MPTCSIWEAAARPANGGDFMSAMRFAALVGALAFLSTPAAAQTISWDGATWLVEDIAGRGVIDNAQTTLVIGPDGKTSGSTGCNRFIGKATIAGDRIRFGQMGVTLRACPPALGDQERKFLTALKQARAARLDAMGRLQILSESGEALLTLTRL
ncbi:MAG: META domain-containing protein [Methylocystis sp.]|nr:MAG: META domain-containing protein [Methylocystis sp.]